MLELEPALGVAGLDHTAQPSPWRGWDVRGALVFGTLARHFSATVQECARAFGGTHTNVARSHRGGCHDRSAERSSAILVFGRVRYRGCDCGRDHTDLM